MQFERINKTLGRSPHGERGLKSNVTPFLADKIMSLSSWRAWIEIFIPYRFAANVLVALLMESVD